MSEVVELGLRKPEVGGGISVSHAPSTPDVGEAVSLRADLKGVVGRLIDILAGSSLESDGEDGAAFKSSLQDLDKQLIDASHRQEILLVATAALKLAKQHVQQTRTYYARRESELSELISVLREAAEGALGESSQSYHQAVLTSVDRLRVLGQLSDIRTLRTALAGEVAALRTLTAEKLRQDQAALAVLNERVSELEDSLRVAKEEASMDALTQVQNRAGFNRAIKRLMAAAKQNGDPLTLAMLDVNKFKIINDTYGHTVGDSLLRFTGKALADAFRPEDTVARYGGDEFAVLVPGADVSKVSARLGSVVSELADRVYEYEQSGETLRLRFSVGAGLTQFWHGDSEADFIQRADEGLYESKRKPGSVVVKKRSRLAGILGI
jgi:diguanylate cyclase